MILSSRRVSVALRPCFVFVTRLVLLVPVTKVSASLLAGSGAVEIDAVPAMLESAAGAGENDAVPALSERVSGLVETNAVPVLLEIAAVRVQKRCIDPGTGDVRRVIDSGRLRGVADAAAATAGESERIIARGRPSRVRQQVRL